MKRLLISLLTASFLLAGCSSLPELGINDFFNGCTSQSRPQSDDLAAKKEPAEMKGDMVVLYACLPSRERSENEFWLRASGIQIGRFLVKEVLLGYYSQSFVEVTVTSMSEFWPGWLPGEYVLIFKKHECGKTSIVKIGGCDDGYVDAREPIPNDPAVHVCVEKVCKPPFKYSEASISKVLSDTGGIPFIVGPSSNWGLQEETFESKDHWWDGPRVYKGIRFDALRKCLEAGKCVP